MLPYQLRPPRFGNRAENSRRKNDPSFSSGGGPIQFAIKSDLVGLCAKFRRQLHAKSEHPRRHVPHEQQSSNCTPLSHWESGIAFAIFKTEFESAKAAMIHLLFPPRCDREAYSQLAYAACLDLLKESFIALDECSPHHLRTVPNGNDNHPKGDETTPRASSLSSESLDRLEDAAFAVFSLWALFDTNPLPREIPSPLQLLPIGLRSLEDPRTLHRRFFSQNIRIDRQHFILLLRLRELARATQARCHGTLLDRRRLDLEMKDKQPTALHLEELHDDQQATPPWECTCGVSKDILVVIERLIPFFDLCEYTGPVGLEALAGHEDFIQKKDQRFTHNLPLPQMVGHVVIRHPEAFELSHDISTLMKEYQGSIAAMHIPLTTSTFSSRRLREALEPFLSYVNNEEPWSDTRSRLFPQSNKTLVATIADENTIVREPSDDHEMAKPSQEDIIANEGIDSSVVQIEKNPKMPVVTESDQYKLFLRGITDNNFKHHLQTSLRFLLRRDQPLALPVIPQIFEAPESDSLVSAENDVSTIGNGTGASRGTDVCRNAMRKLCAATRRSDSEPVLGVDHLIQHRSEQTISNLFLTSNHHEKDFGPSDNDSLDSSDVTNPSNSDVDDALDDDDDLSVATSAVGKHYFEVLLETVKEGQPEGRTRSRSRKKKRQQPARKERPDRRNVRNKTDDASSAEQGQAADTKLPGRANSRKKARVGSSMGGDVVLESIMDKNSTFRSDRPCKKRHRAQGLTKSATLQSNGEEDCSVASSIGPGAGTSKDFDDDHSVASSVERSKRSLKGLFDSVTQSQSNS